jgi:hypothetical protein
MENQACSPLYNLAPPPPLPPTSPVSLSRSSFLSPVELTDGRGWVGGGRGAKSYDGERAWCSINHLILSYFAEGKDFKQSKVTTEQIWGGSDTCQVHFEYCTYSIIFLVARLSCKV